MASDGFKYTFNFVEILLKHFTYVSNQLKNLAECFKYKNETLKIY